MDRGMGMLVLGAICIIVLAIGFLRRRAEIILNFVVRAILGALAIYMINILLAGAGIKAAAGMNIINILTVGSLGTGGLTLIYGILFYNLM